MIRKIEIEIVVVMDADGDYVVGVDQDQAQEMFDNDIGGNGPRRVIKLKVLMAPPKYEEGPTVNVPDTAGIIEAAAAE